MMYLLIYFVFEWPQRAWRYEKKTVLAACRWVGVQHPVVRAVAISVLFPVLLVFSLVSLVVSLVSLAVSFLIHTLKDAATALIPREYKNRLRTAEHRFPHFRRMRLLVLYDNPFSAQGVQALRGMLSGLLYTLKNGARALIPRKFIDRLLTAEHRFPHFRQMRLLVLYGNPFSAQGVQALRGMLSGLLYTISKACHRAISWLMPAFLVRWLKKFEARHEKIARYHDIISRGQLFNKEGRHFLFYTLKNAARALIPRKFIDRLLTAEHRFPHFRQMRLLVLYGNPFSAQGVQTLRGMFSGLLYTISKACHRAMSCLMPAFLVRRLKKFEARHEKIACYHDIIYRGQLFNKEGRRFTCYLIRSLFRKPDGTRA